MTDKWDFYPLRVDDKPASIMVDLGLIIDVPIRAFPYMAYIRLHMRNPRDDGLSSQEEYEALIAIEKAIEAGLAASKDAIYVGRNTSDGCRDFYFYIAQAEEWAQRAAQLLEPFPHYKFISGSRPDPEWSTYLEFLYPGDEAMQTITNRRVCDSLAEKGDPLSAEREIDHWIYFPNPAARKLFIAAAAELGFGLRCTTDPEEAGEQYGARMFRIDRPGHDCIDDVTLPLHRLAAKFGGDYDGWETVVLGEPER